MSLDQSNHDIGADADGQAGNGRSLAALDALNFFLADVQSGLLPFLGIYLLTVPGWNPGGIGLVLTIGGIVGLFVQTPAGALIDRTTHKRTLIIIAAAATSIGAFMITIKPSSGAVVTTAQIIIGVAAVAFPPAIAAIALGLVGPRTYTYRTGRMQAFNHAGNLLGAVAYGLVAYLVALRVAFWLAAATGLLVIAVTLFINNTLIDHKLARGMVTQASDDADKPSGFAVLLRSRPLLVLSLAGLLWQLSNGAMLPISGQKLALHDAALGGLFQAALIVVAQLVMIPMAIMIAHRADRWGRKRIFLVAFAVLPIRGLLFALAGGPGWVIVIQILDGVGAGIFMTMFTLVIADLTRGTGRFNLALGAATTLQGIGAALSTSLAGAVIVAGGFTMAFVVLTAVAVLALIVFAIGVPETAHRSADFPTGQPSVATP